MQHPPALSTSRLGALTLVILQLLNHPNSHAQELTPVITERGSHHRVWQQERVKVLPNGRSITNRSSIVELETGMHHQNERGEWLESREEIELFQNGAIARNGPHQVIFEPNINTTGAIDLLTPDRHRLRSHVLGLGLFDPSTGNSELITEIKDSIGELQPPNEIFYRDAFDGIRADLRYTYRKGSFVQDVIVREQVVMPQGFNPATTRLEVWTEFVEAPQPQKSELTRGGMVDEFLVFGAMFIGPGKAFALDEGESRDKAATVAKRWMQIEGRTFLVEAVQFVAVKTELDRLPVPARRAALTPRKQGNAIEANSARRPFPAARQASVRRPEQKIQMAASLTPPGRGLVLDYDLSGGVTNFTFKADTTYYISGTLAASKPTFEGGTVIKYANTNSARINVHQHWLGTNWWRASQYRPVILTARDDHSVGDAIGSGSLSGYYARYGLWFSGASVKLENLRVSHAIVGLCFDETTHTNRHMQFVHCGTAIEANWVNPVLENALVYNGTNVYAGIAEQNVAKIIGHHLTIRDVLNINAIENIYVRFTNCLLINVTGDMVIPTLRPTTSFLPAPVLCFKRLGPQRIT